MPVNDANLELTNCHHLSLWELLVVIKVAAYLPIKRHHHNNERSDECGVKKQITIRLSGNVTDELHSVHNG